MAVELIENISLHPPDMAPVVATWRRTGAREAVVLVHGILCWRRLPEMEEVADHLARGGRDVVSVDVNGHGDDPGRFTWGREEWRQVDGAVRAVLAWGLRRVSVVGFSFGGFHAARAAIAGTPIHRLVLVSAPVDLRMRDVLPWRPRFFFALPHIMGRQRRPARLERPRGLGQLAVRSEQAAAIRQPTLVVHGERDWVIGRRHAARWASWIPGSRLVEIPRGLHAEYLVRSHPAELLEALDAFLQEDGPCCG
jgi:pimeloyl-ACP methyl ester carboxylesterase